MLAKGVIVGLRQYCDSPPRGGPRDGDVVFKTAGGGPEGANQQIKGGGASGRRKGIWNWSVPMAEEAAPGQDVYCSFEHKGLAPAAQ